jgi:hypothetical protein
VIEPFTPPAKLKDGIVTFIQGELPDARKLLAIDVRHSFPMISLGKNPILIHPDGSMEDIKRADHLSVPADLRLHITSPTTHIMFDVSPIWDMIDILPRSPITHLFSFVGLPIDFATPLVKPGQRKVWHQGALISPMPDKNFSLDTRLCIEFFIHSIEFCVADTEAVPFTIPKMNMRLAPDRNGPVFGPFYFGELQRRDRPPRGDIMFSIRMCWTTPEDNRPTTFTYTPLAEFARRHRGKTT